MLRYVIATMFLISAVSISQGLEVGDTVLRTPITSGDAEIKFVDFHGKFNLIVVRDAAKYGAFNAQLEQQVEVFKAKYDAAVLRLQGEGEILLIDKSGYVRWKFASVADATQPTVKQLESELTKLKRDNPLPIGASAPDFRLVDAESGLPFSLSEHKGKKHVLVTLLLQTY